MKIQYTNEMIDFIQDSPCSFLAVANVKENLDKKGFSCLDNKDKWEIKKGGKYYITRNESSLIAFVVGQNAKEGFRGIGSHTDSPSFMIKPNAEVVSSCKYLKLNTEGYGGMILSTWLDRPLSMAGRLVLKGDSILKPKTKLVDFKRAIAIIPNVAIHLNRDINNGYKYSKQKDMLPLLSLTGENFNKEGYLLDILSKEFNVAKDDILDYELYLYDAQKGNIMGFNDEFVSCSRLDDLMMVYNSFRAFLSSADSFENGINLLYLADNEEVGSKTGQGADSSLLRDTLRRICISLFKDEESFYAMCEKSIFLSSDLAHAIHPNAPDKHDITNTPILNEGICLKYSASQKYSTNSIGASVFDLICKEAGIKYQKFANHSDAPGGSTIGTMLASQLNATVIDFGVAILGMHSIRELATVNDIYDCYKFFEVFYKL